MTATFSKRHEPGVAKISSRTDLCFPSGFITLELAIPLCQFLYVNECQGVGLLRDCELKKTVFWVYADEIMARWVSSWERLDVTLLGTMFLAGHCLNPRSPLGRS